METRRLRGVGQQIYPIRSRSDKMILMFWWWSCINGDEEAEPQIEPCSNSDRRPTFKRWVKTQFWRLNFYTISSLTSSLSPPSPSCLSPLLLIHFCPRTAGHLVALHILACHLVSPPWLRMGPPILSYSYSASILFPQLLYSTAPAPPRFFIYFHWRDQLVNCTPS